MEIKGNYFVHTSVSGHKPVSRALEIAKVIAEIQQRQAGITNINTPHSFEQMSRAVQALEATGILKKLVPREQLL